MKADHPLFKIAQSQSGLFTSHQAISAGIDSRNHSYHLKAGNWLRVKKGIYQLQFIQPNLKREFFLFQLWARNREGKSVGVFSYETALYLMGLKIDYPKKIHITVPNYFRRSGENDKLVLHYENLSPSEKTSIDNLHITNIKKTFQDLLSSGSYHPEQIKKYLKIVIERKQISLNEVKKISVNEEAQRIFNAILFELY